MLSRDGSKCIEKEGSVRGVIQVSRLLQTARKGEGCIDFTPLKNRGRPSMNEEVEKEEHCGPEGLFFVGGGGCWLLFG